MSALVVCRSCRNILKKLAKPNCSLKPVGEIVKLAEKVTPLASRNFSSVTSRRRQDETNDEYRHSATLDREEVEKFNELCHTWWNEGGEFGALHSLNDLRIPLVRDAILGSAETEASDRPLEGVKVMDVGCGGGILSEPLARLGATVTGVDAGEENICIAEWHRDLDPSLTDNLEYTCSLVEDLVPTHNNLYDGLVASEIIEHVADPHAFVSACCDIVKPGGSLFFTTISKTWLSYALAVVAAEKIFRIVPSGIHDWNKFISPEDLKYMLKRNGASVELVHGMILNPVTWKWSWTKDTQMNYAIHAVKDN